MSFRTLASFFVSGFVGILAIIGSFTFSEDWNRLSSYGWALVCLVVGMGGTFLQLWITPVTFFVTRHQGIHRKHPVIVACAVIFWILLSSMWVYLVQGFIKS